MALGARSRWMGVWSGWGCSIHMHMHVHACTHTNMHMYTLNMIISIANACPNREFPMMSYTCMHVHLCEGHPCTTPHPHPPTPTPHEGDPWNQSKFNNTWTNQDISILFEDYETPPPMDGCMVWWVGGCVGWWVGLGQITKNLKNVD